MPRTRLERLLLTVGVLALAVLVALAVRGWQRYHRGPATTAGAPVRTQHRKVATAARARGGRLVLRAVRGPSWLAVRAGGAGGPLLYRATLSRGRRVRLPGDRFWIRAGAASNVAASFDGRPVRGFPGGTVTLLIVDGVARVLR